jgi:Na+/H+ antiporter NhaD/arsenite permease-like protein
MKGVGLMSVAVTMQMILSAAIFFVTYGALILRNRRWARLPLWLVFLMGGALVMLAGLVSPAQAQSAVDLRVIAFLFSMFAITAGLQISGDLDRFTRWIVSHAHKPGELVLFVSAGFGLASSVLMNDTLAVMGTPLLIATARSLGIRAKPLLLTLAFSVSIGSAMTPLGNPQNMLIAVESGISQPFLAFVYYILPSTLINIGILSGFIYFAFRRDLEVSHEKILVSEPRRDDRLSLLSRAALAAAVGGMLATNLLSLFGVNLDLGISEVALSSAAFLLLASERRNEILAKVDWGVLVMFAGLFVFTKGIYNGGLIDLVRPVFGSFTGLGLLLFIVVSSVALSQVVSNVPLVTLLLPLYAQVIPGTSAAYWAAFAGASTLAGNVTLLGAASNLIIVEQAEKEGEQIGFGEFLKLGIPLSLACLTVFILTFVPYAR